MRKLIAFTSVSVDGRFTDANGDISWAHRSANAPEFDAFVARNAKGGGTLLFGRITYEMMASHWPTAAAMEQDPEIAEAMNRLPKVVFSRTLGSVTWNNTRLVKGGVSQEIQRMKQEPGSAMVILGSGTIVSQLAQDGLIDEFQSVVIPVVLGSGRSVFDGVQRRLSLTLARSRAFSNGNVLLCHEAME